MKTPPDHIPDPASDPLGYSLWQEQFECVHCWGTGGDEEEPCRCCDGTGIDEDLYNAQDCTK